MKAPPKGSGATIEGYGRVLVKGGPSPDHPYVWFEYGPVDDAEYDELHIDEWKERRAK